MRHPVWAWLALSSLAITPAPAATRPHYGGSLTVELSSAWTTLDAARLSALSLPIAETLVRIDDQGAAQPALCIAWQHDADFKRWRLSLHPKVTFHDGQPLTGPAAAPPLLSALKKKYPDVSIQAGGQAIEIRSSQAMPDLLEDLAAPDAAIVRSSDADPLIGTGPFRVTAWEPGRRLALAAFDDYWNARPFLDSVTIEFGANRGRADIFDIPVGPSRRILPEGIVTWPSAPRTLLAITAANAQPAVLQALSLVIDRAPIVNVLAQHKGEAAFGLLPQWLTGYEFLFQSTPDPARAKQIAGQTRSTPLTLSYPANDAFLRSVAERIALNARDAGVTIQPTPNPNGNLRLIEWPLESKDAAFELGRLAESLGPARQFGSTKPQALYEFEKSLLDDHRIIPLAYLRETFGLAPRVHVELSAPDAFTLHLDNAWLLPESKQ